MAYENVTFNSLGTKRLKTVREKVAALWADGFKAPAISKRVRVSTRSVATALGNLTRNNTKPAPRKSAPRKPRK